MITDQETERKIGFHTNIRAFLEESHRIEGYSPEHLTEEEFEYAISFLRLKEIKTDNVEKYVSITAPHAVLRDKCGLNVRVGNHIAPGGGVFIAKELDRILWDINNNTDHPYLLHHEYETLHPFTDGNGRSGRLIWLWQMEHFYNGAPLGFLHTWYYESLDNGRSG